MPRGTLATLAAAEPPQLPECGRSHPVAAMPARMASGGQRWNASSFQDDPEAEFRMPTREPSASKPSKGHKRERPRGQQEQEEKGPKYGNPFLCYPMVQLAQPSPDGAGANAVAAAAVPGGVAVAIISLQRLVAGHTQAMATRQTHAPRRLPEFL
eukprot:TRINITY_DN4171_c0_g2_i2.p1 TRINITY_DN4171_c0_g2~~TRINITY_DN4171_c0_g2_i2.p1  ORF type:complete len:179 (-),score=12.20 TRINITY_DN4171_c0_g2_i2:47-511(-)